MGNQHNSLEFDSTEKMFRDFQEIEKNKNIISSLLEDVDWVTELFLSHNMLIYPLSYFSKMSKD